MGTVVLDLERETKTNLESLNLEKLKSKLNCF